MYHGKCQYKIRRTGKTGEARRLRFGQPDLHPFQQPGRCQPPLQPRQHLRLNIHRHYPARRAYAARQLQGEKAHTRAGLDHDHAGAYVGLQDSGRILPEAPDGASQNIAQPPRANAMVLVADVRFLHIRMDTSETPRRFLR